MCNVYRNIVVCNCTYCIMKTNKLHKQLVSIVKKRPQAPTVIFDNKIYTLDKHLYDLITTRKFINNKVPPELLRGYLINYISKVGITCTWDDIINKERNIVNNFLVDENGNEFKTDKNLNWVIPNICEFIPKSGNIFHVNRDDSSVYSILSIKKFVPFM